MFHLNVDIVELINIDSSLLFAAGLHCNLFDKILWDRGEEGGGEIERGGGGGGGA